MRDPWYDREPDHYRWIDRDWTRDDETEHCWSCGLELPSNWHGSLCEECREHVLPVVHYRPVIDVHPRGGIL